MSGTCKHPSCDRPVIPYEGKGRPPLYCEEHTQKKKRRRQRLEKQAEAAAQEARAKVLGFPGGGPAGPAEPRHANEEELERASSRQAHKREGAKRAELLERAWRPQLLAVHLQDGVEPARAAELAGVTYEDDEELAEIAEEARRFPRIIERSNAAAGELISAALMTFAIRANVQAHAVSASQIPTGIFKLTDAFEKVVGKVQSVFTALSMHLDPFDATELIARISTTYGIPEEALHALRLEEQWKDLLPPELADTSLPSSSEPSPTPRNPSETTPSEPPSTGPPEDSSDTKPK